jgi:phosphoketolase
MPPNTPPTLGKNRWRIEKMNCKTMKQTENDQNHKKQSTLVVGKKPYGKSRFVMLPPSDLLTILCVVPRFLGELDSVNAMISSKTESL